MTQNRRFCHSPPAGLQMKDKIKRWLPERDQLQHNRWLRWLGPALYHPRLWRMSRKGVALGVAIGIFFGFLIPIAQIPFSAALAVALRANLPVAMASTLVTNPVTFGPVYYAAYHVGRAVLGTPASEPTSIPPALPASSGSSPVGADPAKASPATAAPGQGWWATLMGHLSGVGKPVLVGLVIFACGGGLLVYALISGLWILKTRWQRRQRVKGHKTPQNRHRTKPGSSEPL